MPELPEVETVCEGLRRSVLDEKIQTVTLNRPDLRIPFPKNMRERLKGHKVKSISRRAKYIIAHFGNSLVLAIHLGMSGRLMILGAAEEYKKQTHDHMVIKMESGKAVVFNDPRRFGMVYLLHEDDLDTHKAFKHLGPEPLGNDFSAPVLKEKLKNKKSAIKTAIMDQRVVVGVGNIYACEALYRSGIHPNRPANTIKGKRADKLVQEIRNVLGEAIAAGGSSLKDYRHTDGELGYFQHRFSVYGREKEKCPACDCDNKKTEGVRRIVQSGRSTFYCPVKQT